MCLTCYEYYNSPKIDSDQVLQAVSLLEAVDEYSAAHTVVDDWNLEDEHIDFCLKQADRTSNEHACLVFMKSMTVEERAAALGLSFGFWHTKNDDTKEQI
jgi:hypothetical protein